MDTYTKVAALACNVLLLSVSQTVTGCGSENHHKAENQPVFEMESEAKATGLSWLSAQNGKCSFITALQDLERPMLAFLWSSFGKDPACIKQFLDLPQQKRLHVYLSNGSCERSDTCSEREIEHEREIPARLLQVLELVSGHDVVLSVAPGLEDNFTSKKAQRLGRELKRLAPDIILVRNSVSSSEPLEPPYDVIEYHHSAPTEYPCIWSNDGRDSPIDGDVWDLPMQYSVDELTDQLKSVTHCERIVWLAEANCLETDASRSPFPHQRECADGVTRKLIKYLKNIS